ncbi:uncharacterized protein [Dermacentor albipictus]|uniref:uncharacterized protein isoform X2 n=1 Tax=Dermacentor albipictus TaxID=60249 RepID=UPI0038FD2AB8
MRVCRCFQTALLRLETSEASGSMSAAEFQLRRVLSVPLETFGGIGLASSTFSSTAAMASATVGQLDIPKSTVGSGFVCPSNNPADRMDVRWPRAALPSFYGGTFQARWHKAKQNTLYVIWKKPEWHGSLRDQRFSTDSNWFCSSACTWEERFCTRASAVFRHVKRCGIQQE